MNHPFIKMLVRWSVLALGVTIATKIVPGIRCDDASTLIAVVLLLSLFNAILKPLLVLFTLPFIVVTMGLGLIVINAFLFAVVGKLVDGFYVGGFWPAVGGAVVVSLTNFILSGFTRDRGPGAPPRGGPGVRPPAPPRERVRGRDDDVIDI
jgi:putative membrane protein